MARPLRSPHRTAAAFAALAAAAAAALFRARAPATLALSPDAAALAAHISPGRGGQPRVLATHAASGAALEVYLHGATATSYTHAARELLFLSPRAAFDGRAPIRGGIPVVFPQFGPGALPQHGFARTRAWRLARAGDGCVELELRDDAETRALWPHAFRAALRFDFAGPALAATLRVENPAGAPPLAFDALLHAYLELGAGAVAAGGAGSAVRVRGLGGAAFRPRGGAPARQEEAELQLAGEVDRVYAAPAADAVEVAGGRDGRAVRVTRAASVDGARVLSDVVVWNPAADRCATMADLSADSWTQFICIEPGRVANESVLPGGGLAGGSAFELRVDYVMA